MSDKQEDLETLNSAGRSMSDNVDFISRKNGYIIYEHKWDINQELENAQEIVDSSPDYMTESELNFLKAFIKEFKEAETAGTYNLENQVYLKLFRNLLGALNTRMKTERKELAEKGEDMAFKIQHLFYLIDNAIDAEFEQIEENWEELIKGNRDLLESADRVNLMIKQLVRAYSFEFTYLEKGEVNEEAVEKTERELRKKWTESIGRDRDGLYA